MKSGSFVPENLLGGDTSQTVPGILPGSSNANMPIGQSSRLVGRHDGKRAGDLRSIVARRFMRMLRAHDRARMKVLATHPTQAR
jgi:hypothetical protein